MSSAVDIQIVSMPNLAKIESFLKNASYRETIEYSANFNTRLCIERRHRVPFFDPQTGVAQNHSQLFMDERQRMPGFRQGQIYTYPAARWRKSRRQYLNRMYRFPDRPFQALRKEHEALIANASGSGSGITLSTAAGTTTTTTSGASTLHHSDNANFCGAFAMEESSSLGAAGGDTSDSKDSQLQSLQQQQQQQQAKEDLPKEWFYDDIDMNDVDSLEEPKSPADDEYDYDPRYGTKKRRKRRSGKRSTLHIGGDLSGGSTGGRRRSGAGRGRATTTDATLDASLEAIEAGADVAVTPTTSGGRRSRGSGTRGRRRAKPGSGIGSGGSGASHTTNARNPHSLGLASEPPSFESAAAAVGVVEDDGHLRNYRKYL